jgi:hypothetical protein
MQRPLIGISHQTTATAPQSRRGILPRSAFAQSARQRPQAKQTSRLCHVPSFACRVGITVKEKGWKPLLHCGRGILPRSLRAVTSPPLRGVTAERRSGGVFPGTVFHAPHPPALRACPLQRGIEDRRSADVSFIPPPCRGLFSLPLTRGGAGVGFFPRPRRGGLGVSAAGGVGLFFRPPRGGLGLSAAAGLGFSPRPRRGGLGISSAGGVGLFSRPRRGGLGLSATAGLGFSPRPRRGQTIVAPGDRREPGVAREDKNRPRRGRTLGELCDNSLFAPFGDRGIRLFPRVLLRSTRGYYCAPPSGARKETPPPAGTRGGCPACETRRGSLPC